MRAKRADYIWKIVTFSLISRRGQIIYFQLFQDQNIYFQKVPAPPPPSESNGCPLKEKNIVLAVH